MKKIKTNKGITLITLIVTIIVVLILTTITVTSTGKGTEFRRYSLMCSDVEMLEDKIIHFYRQYNELPIGSEMSNLPTAIDNEHVFYEININLLSNITLNYGAEDDKYIVDSETFEVYYLNGIEYEGKIYYTD